jgi:CheY-like chemotaxis protein
MTIESGPAADAIARDESPIGRFGSLPLSPTLDIPFSAERSFLLAEDSENDAFLMQRAFQAAGIAELLHVVPDGQAAVDYLCATADNGRGHPLTKVVLLDLDLPRKNGFEVLAWLRTQARFKSLVTVIITASNREADADQAYSMGADFYLTKPRTFGELVQMTRCLYQWLQLNQFATKATA